MQHVAIEQEEALQAERTSLSWFRTALGFAAVAALAFRQAPAGAGRAVALAVGAVTLGAVVGVSSRRSRQLRGEGHPTMASPASLVTVTSAIVLVNAVAIVLFL